MPEYSVQEGKVDPTAVLSPADDGGAVLTGSSPQERLSRDHHRAKSGDSKPYPR